MARLFERASAHRRAVQPSAKPPTPIAQNESYERLRRIARRYLRLHRRSSMMQTTVLAHEVWIRIRGALEAGTEGELRYAARAIRAILVDEARKEGAAKRGGSWRRIDMDSFDPTDTPITVDLLDLDVALEELERSHSRAARIVELRFFGGLGVHETALLLDLGDRTVESELRLARAMLRVRLERR